MNILFLMKVFEVGGQEKVTEVLAECFANHGHKVCIASFAPPKGLIAENMDRRIEMIDLHSNFRVNDEVVSRVRTLLVDKKIDVVINQWGLPYVPAMVLKRAKSGLKTKVISVYHNDPSTNARIKDVEIALEKCSKRFNHLILRLKKYIFCKITSMSMRYVYDNSDVYEVLSSSFIQSFQNFTKVKDVSKLIVQTNPLTINSNNYQYRLEAKQKEIIYCGRIDYNQKRVVRLIETWALIENDFPEWKLTIVGDGVARKEVEERTAELSLKNVRFEGFKDPIEYYKRASILALNSEYEGFPLVLAECMSFGVVPVVYDSFSAVHDIIQDGVNGVIVPKVNGGFSAEKMAEGLRRMMIDDIKRESMAHSAIKRSHDFSIDKIYQQWEKVFNNLLKEQ